MTRLSADGKKQYLFLSYIFCAFISIQFICDALVMRLVQVGSLEFTASSIIFCLDFALMDIVANVYGMHEARKLAFIDFGMQISVGAAIYLCLFSFNPADYSNLAYQETATQFKNFALVLSRNIVLSTAATLLANLSNAFFMTTSKYLLYGRFVALRSLICTTASAFLMLMLSYTIFYWHTGFPYILHVVFSSMVVKILGAVICMLPAQYLSYMLKKKEGVDVYDLKFKFFQARQKAIVERLKQKKVMKI